MSTNIFVFPGGTISPGDAQGAIVTAVQRRLNELGCGPLQPDGVFGPRTSGAVGKFQARHGLPVSGSVDEATWVALFEQQPAAPPLLSAVVREARSQVGVMEQPLGSNRGPQVDQYLLRVGLNPTAGSYPWCAAFVDWCVQAYASEGGTKIAHAPRTAAAFGLITWGNDNHLPVFNGHTVNFDRARGNPAPRDHGAGGAHGGADPCCGTCPGANGGCDGRAGVVAQSRCDRAGRRPRR